MAEPSKENCKRFVGVFAAEYNKANGTSFDWDDQRSFVAQYGSPYDVILFDGRKELKLQLTLSVGDIDKEIIRPKRAGKVTDQLISLLETNSKIPSIFVYINFHKPPVTPKEIREAVYFIELVIREKVEDSLGPSFISYNAHFDDQFFPRIQKYVSKLRVTPALDIDGKKTIRLAYGTSDDKIEPLVDEVDRIIATIEKKEFSSRDTTLLVSAGMYPIEDFSISKIKERLVNKNIKEIWLVEDFYSPGSRAVRLK